MSRSVEDCDSNLGTTGKQNPGNLNGKALEVSRVELNISRYLIDVAFQGKKVVPSRVRVTVVPTAHTRPPAARAELIVAAADADTTYAS